MTNARTGEPNPYRSLNPLVGGADHPLARASRIKNEIIEDVIERSLAEIKVNFAEKIRDALYWERIRLSRPSEPVRDAMDEAFWKKISRDFNAAEDSEEDSKEILRRILHYHGQEIIGHFNPRIYTFASIVLPRIFTWLLRAVSWKSFRSIFPGQYDLRDRLHIEGHVDQIRNLSQKGTVLLVPMHFSNLDSVLLGWILYEMGLPPFCYGAGLNLFSNILLGFFMSNLGAYKVDRRKKHDLYKVVLKNYSTAVLERGVHSLFFPSGGRSRTGGIPEKLKLGLLGTGLEAYINNLKTGKANPNIYIVPCTISYHFVLEASNLIEDYLTDQGKNRFLSEDDDASKPKQVLNFFRNFFTTSSKFYLNFGQAIDPFGHLVDENGVSRSDTGRPLELEPFVKTNGVICHDTQRDSEYTRILGDRLVQRYYRENFALTSHFVAYTYFEFLRRKYSPKDLFKLFKISTRETETSFQEYVHFAEPILKRLHRLYDEGALYLEPALRSDSLVNIVDAAARNLGVYHAKRPLRVAGDIEKEPASAKLVCEDLKLLFYYHNRMEGYPIL